MTAGALAGLTGSAQAQQTQGGGKSNAFASLSTSEFVKILTTQLTHQDPFKPTKSTKVLEQLSSLRNIESQMQLQDRLKNLVNQNQVAQASSLIGQMVSGMDMDNERIEGVVTSVRVVDGKPVLELDTGKQLAMERVTAIVGSSADSTPSGPEPT